MECLTFIHDIYIFNKDKKEKYRKVILYPLLNDKKMIYIIL